MGSLFLVFDLVACMLASPTKWSSVIRCLLILMLAKAIDVSFAQLSNALSLYVVLKECSYSKHQMYSTFGGTQVLYITLYIKIKCFTQLSFLVAHVLVSTRYKNIFKMLCW